MRDLVFALGGTMTTARRVPAGLSVAGKRLWKDTLATYELDPAEHELLMAACRSLTELERVEKELAAGPLMVTGSTGQPVPNPLLAEARAYRKTVESLLRGMARFRRPNDGMTRDDLWRLLDDQLPLPDAMVDRDGWRWVMARRRERAAEFGFDALDVVLISRDAKRARMRGDMP